MSFISARDAGSKVGSAGVASATHANVQRRERLRQLALEHVDLTNDPYFFRNNIGKYECKLCMTMHVTEGSYLAHTQGKRHQEALAKRAAQQQKRTGVAPAPEKRKIAPRKTVKIGRPGYKVVKLFDPATQQRALLFQVQYPRIEKGLQPRHRFMSAYEQKVEAPNEKYQYLLFAAEPYETISFKIPNDKIDKGDGKFFTHWNADTSTLTVQLSFVADPKAVAAAAAAAVAATHAVMVGAP
jgi:splicing factor 3A subunit 2